MDPRKPVDREPDWEPMDPLWIELDRALHRNVPGESIIERLATPIPAWKDPVVLAVWVRITDPVNLRELEKRAERIGAMNPAARMYTLHALRECRRRARRDGAGSGTSLP